MNTPYGEPRSPWSAQDQIAAHLRDGILNGTWEPGAKLPSYAKLSTKFGVAPQTMRNALAVLEAEQLIHVRHGFGVVVLPHQMHTHPTQDEHQEVLYVAPVQPPRYVYTALGYHAETIVRAELTRRDNQPASFTQHYLPRRLTRGTPLENEEPTPHGVAHLLEELKHGPLQHVDHVSARCPTPQQAAALQTATRQPVLRVRRLTRGAGNKPLMLSIIINNALMHELEYEQPPHTHKGHP